MTPTKTVNFSNIFLIFRNFKGQFEEQELTGPFFALTFKDHYYLDRCFLSSSVIRRLRVKMLLTNPVYIIDGNGRERPILSREEEGSCNLRFRKDNAVYMQKWGLERKGSHVLVIREPYLRNYDDNIVRKVWEELRAEYKNIIKLREYLNLVKLLWMIMEVNDDGLTPKIANFRELKFKALGNIMTITSLGFYGLLIYNVIPIYIASALETFRSILKGLLYKEPNKKRPVLVSKDDGCRNIWKRRNL
ncbi:kinase-like protein [Cenococcum geophilum]